MTALSKVQGLFFSLLAANITIAALWLYARLS